MKALSKTVKPPWQTSVLLPFLLALSGQILPAMTQSSGAFTSAGDMTAARIGHTATLLLDGRVLIAGGYNGRGNALASTELYDPSTGTFTSAADMTTARSFHTATLLSDGRVLIAGGLQASVNRSLASAELYDPSTETFTATGFMTTPCFVHTATLLPTGQVLIAGGESNGDPSGDPERCSSQLYDPAVSAFAGTGSMSTVQIVPTATLLTDGTVLLASRNSAPSASFAPATSEIYDPFKGEFSRNGAGEGMFLGHTATLLADGKVMLAGGGATGESGSVFASVILYDPAGGKFTATEGWSRPRTWHATSLLPDGTVLIAGGSPLNTPVSSADLFNPLTGTFSPTGDMITGRSRHKATLLSNGDVLITGGFGLDKDQTGLPLASAELYHPAAVSPYPEPAATRLSPP